MQVVKIKICLKHVLCKLVVYRGLLFFIITLIFFNLCKCQKFVRYSYDNLKDLTDPLIKIYILMSGSVNQLIKYDDHTVVILN